MSYLSILAVKQGKGGKLDTFLQRKEKEQAKLR